MGEPNSAGPFRIEKGVPLPPEDVGRIGGRTPKYPWRQMEIGDSFVAPTTQDSIKGARHYAQRATGFRFVTRAVEGGVRVWRVAPPPPENGGTTLNERNDDDR